MRGQDSSRRLRRPEWQAIAAGIVVFLATAAFGQVVQQTVPQLEGPTPSMETGDAKPLPKWIVDDKRRMRAYPDQPPIIPHSIEGYELSVNANRCLSCHKREFTQDSGAPMISVTHYMTRDGQMLADVSPRRYFCTACHVPQADTPPLVPNAFKDMSELGFRPAGSE
ncbi:nitrate reductase cytochrome c-type subunit [Rhizobium chutanense]|uniref:Periplasmic nitrate reductase, electron transfer subunit n=1 Tax=Rhizobium chutanense TaxID=2035448 RepID=A0A432NLE9_9HYPH|nr:nitrate reductase cytochrome c-type subunit [Rhizobium chutanense]RUM00372.1 nitrate reductase cytochrome c-type subunit [Rhizobium chutanense]